MTDAWEWMLGRKRMNHRKRSNGHFRKEFERHYPAVFLIFITVLSAGWTGYYVGSITNKPMSSGFNPPVEETPSYITEAFETDTTDTEITNTVIANGTTTFEFTGNSINETAKFKGFVCRINLEDFIPCESPFIVRELEKDDTFEVAAFDTEGNIDNTPAAWFGGQLK